MDIENYAERTAVASDYSYRCDVYERPTRQHTCVRFWIRLDGVKYGREAVIEVRDSPDEVREKIEGLGNSLDTDLSNGVAQSVPEKGQFPLI